MSRQVVKVRERSGIRGGSGMPWPAKASGIGWGTGSADKPMMFPIPPKTRGTKSGGSGALQGCFLSDRAEPH